MSQIINGIIASPGIKIGKVYLYKDTKIYTPKYTIEDEKVDEEIHRFESALKKTKEDIKAIQEQIASSLSKDIGDIFASHIMVLEDPQIDEKTKEIIRKEKRNAEWVLSDITMELMHGLKSIKDEYLRERLIDISDINKRLIGNLQKTESESLADLKEEVIVFASDLTPSDTAMMNKKLVLAFVTDKGGRTSHTAIMARALEIPAIVGAIDGTSTVKDGDIVIVDGIHGQVIVNPTAKEIKEYTREQEELMILESELSKLRHLPSKTLDKDEVFLHGNIEIPEEMEVIKSHGAQGIGLFRTEFLFLGKSLPDEEKQYQEYRKVVEFFAPLPVIIRTLDIGGDKIFAYTNSYRERNPFLGCRAIRFSLENEELFRTQLKAILRCSHHGSVKLMFPMVSTIEEVLKARDLVTDCMKQLDKKKQPYNKKIPIGIMLEVPSVIITADVLSKYVDFFSVGTNDLVQYTLAVDRISEKIAYLYNPVNLSILRLLRQIVDISNNENIPISICGEMAGEPKYTMLLLGLGFRNLSMGPAYMYQVKRIIRSVNISDCRELAERLLKLELTRDIEKELISTVKEKFPWLSL